MTWIKENIALLVAAFVCLTGLFFLTNIALGTAIVESDTTAKVTVGAIAGLLTLSGLGYGYLIWTDRLTHKGPTVTEVRKEAVGNLDSESLLSDIVHNDPSRSVRREAARRLQEIEKG